MENERRRRLEALEQRAYRWAHGARRCLQRAVRHLGVAKVRGRFDDIDAKLTVGAIPEETAVEATIGIASIDTGNRDRDADVLSAELLDVELGGIADFFDGTRHAGFEARGELRRKDFGIDFGPLNALLGDAVKIALDLEFIEPS